jgi:hypothetical protein
MEQNFYKDEFEQMLRDTTEDFKMYPSRKVWHSIYNDLHPDRRWPSFAVCLLLLTAILYIGVSNNNSISKNSRINNILSSAGAGTGVIPSAADNKNVIANSGDAAGLQEQTATQSPVVNKNVNGLPGNSGYNTASKNRKESAAGLVDFAPASNNRELARTVNVSSVENAAVLSESGKAIPGNNSYTTFAKDDKTVAAEHKQPAQALQRKKLILNDNSLVGIVLSGSNEEGSNETAASSKQGVDKNSYAKTPVVSTDEKSWIEDFAFHNIRNRNKWKTNMSFRYYITPSLGYRQLRKNNDYDPVSSLLLRTNDNDAVNQQAAPGFEGGVQVVLDLSKKLKFKSGVQFNYTNYITHAHELQHPAQTTVLMNDLNNGHIMPVAYNSNYGNVLGSNFSKLNNSTNQISLPIGAEYMLTGNRKIKWYVGGDIQPSLLLSGNAFLISSDSKNFVEDASLLRKLNLNSNLETFVSFKTPSGVDINVGPQLRYQLFSTYTDKYSYTEKLFNLGLKVGVTKKL